MDDDGPTGGVERAAQQGIDAFAAPQFPDPVPAPPPTHVGPPIQSVIPGGPSPNDLFTRPFVMQGGWHVTPDHSSWWNGMMWIPGRPPGSSLADDAETPDSPTSPSAVPPLVLFLVGLAGMAVVAFIAWQAFQTMPTLGPGPPLP